MYFVNSYYSKRGLVLKLTIDEYRDSHSLPIIISFLFFSFLYKNERFMFMSWQYGISSVNILIKYFCNCVWYLFKNCTYTIIVLVLITPKLIFEHAVPHSHRSLIHRIDFASTVSKWWNLWSIQYFEIFYKVFLLFGLNL
jgi:hypothetical protein